MDKGAHFYKCDFQVHSPRDINWRGTRYGVTSDLISSLTLEEKENIFEQRVQFSKEYLSKVRNAGLNAISITDHHDVTFVKTIRKVANEENLGFKERAEFDKVITVFPGIELTLSNPASQCIIIFDSDFSDSYLDSVLNFLGITPTSEFDELTIETQRISSEICRDLVHLHNKLDELLYCRGKYIILPNVGFGGQHSILRQGFHEHYRKMPSVGGYVDKAISNDIGYHNKLNGGDVHYGNKSIGLISTSDNRHEDGRHFGEFSTWIKWAEPTAEAIRQACLAKESRISQSEPELPQVYIKSIDVTASKFIGSFDINFNQQYNALIGGRGTGKSTIFEYVRWALCDQTLQNLYSEDLSVIERRREALISNTLVEANGEVRITMVKNGITHIVKRIAKSKEILLKIGDKDFQSVNEDNIRKLLPIHSYSQKQLSDVGVKIEELKRFIEQPILSSLEALKFRLSETALKIRNSYNQLIRQKEIELEIDKFSLETDSLSVQIENIRKTLKGVSPQDQITINNKTKLDFEGERIENLKNELSIFENKADELISLVELYPEPLGDLELIENRDLLESIFYEASEKFNDIKTIAKSFKSIFDEESLNKLNALISQWNTRKEQFDTTYELAKNNSQSSQHQLTEISKIESRILEINKIISERRLLLKEIGSPSNEFNLQTQNWLIFHREKIDLLNTQAIEFTSLSKDLIKAEVTKSIHLQPLKVLLKSLFEGTRIREERIDAIIDKIRHSYDPLNEYYLIINELRLLAEVKVSSEMTPFVPETPILSQCGFTEEHKQKLTAKITTDDWLRISVGELEFIPEFFYTTNNKLGDKIPFSQASAGQQATALLTVLLNQKGIPLLIDQPEDDIDNRAIEQIIRNIWDSKKKRQLLFTSHNANLVVNGDAELVICCDYKDSSSQTRGFIKAEGSIDNLNVKNEITSVMEGGEKAFKLRKEKYGF